MKFRQGREIQVKKQKRALMLFLIFLGMAAIMNTTGPGFSQDLTLPSLEVNFGSESTENGAATTVQILLLFTVLSLAPSILIMTTCFTRIIIILSFVRRALALQSTPPNQVVIGLALFLTFFIMSPTISEIKEQAYDPLISGEIGQQEAIEKAVDPLRNFMLRQVRTKDLKLFIDLGGVETINDYNDIPTTALIPAFIISELKTGFEVGFLLFIPFIVVDMIVASTLMALGMMMLPPVMISLPFKILLFILVDGWNLIVEKMILSIR